MKFRFARTPLAVATVTGALVAGLLGAAGIASAGPVAHPDVVVKDPVNFTPHLERDGVRPQAFSIEKIGNTMYVGGRFDRVQNANRTQSYVRHNLMAFDANTGALRDFNPNVSGCPAA